MTKPEHGSLRVWHTPMLPGPTFYVAVVSPEEAMKVLVILADYDAFQLEHRIKPDYMNASGLEVFEDGEWIEWVNDDGEEIDDLLIAREAEHPAEGVAIPPRPK